MAEDERVVVVLDDDLAAAGANAEAAVAVKKRVSSFMIVVICNVRLCLDVLCLAYVHCSFFIFHFDCRQGDTWKQIWRHIQSSYGPTYDVFTV